MSLICFTLADDRKYCDITIIMIYYYPEQVNLYKYINASHTEICLQLLIPLSSMAFPIINPL